VEVFLPLPSPAECSVLQIKTDVVLGDWEEKHLQQQLLQPVVAVAVAVTVTV